MGAAHRRRRARHAPGIARSSAALRPFRIAAIPTALAMVAMLTTPYRAKHPEVRFTILSQTSIEVLGCSTISRSMPA